MQDRSRQARLGFSLQTSGGGRQVSIAGRVTRHIEYLKSTGAYVETVLAWIFLCVFRQDVNADMHTQHSLELSDYDVVSGAYISK